MIKTIAILTSGGDSPGMNAAVRAAVRVAIDKGLRVMGVLNGYQGLVTGNVAGQKPNIVELKWRSVSGILNRGGTFIGTARSEEFRTAEGQQKALANLRQEGVNALVVIGGDGSLRGARDLCKLGFPAICLPGTIDNDLVGTDMSIGTDTALNTAMHVVDTLSDTASSHNRTFIVEAMGRLCGYLALMTALTTAAEGAIIPEEKYNLYKLKDMLDALLEGYRAGKQHGIIIVSEGANYDADFIRDFIEQESDPKVEVRITIPGHVQRGGTPTPYDRILGMRLGAAAVERLLSGESNVMVGLQDDEIVTRSLDEIASRSGRSYIEESPNLRDAVELQRVLSKPYEQSQGRKNLALMTCGKDAPGVNAAIRAITRMAIDRDCAIFGVEHGMKGLIEGGNEIYPLNWMSVDGIIGLGGTILGNCEIARLTTEELQSIAQNLAQKQIDGLIIIGDRDSFEMAQTMKESLELKMPIALVPAAIDNNLPHTEMCIGADTALATIVNAIDRIKDTASSNHQVFIVQVAGEDCGYLALMSGLASGAEKVFIPEEGIKPDEVQEFAAMLKNELASGRSHGVIVVSEAVSKNDNVDFISRIILEGAGLAPQITRLGHLQYGGSPTAFDRALATRLGAGAVKHVLEGQGVKIIGLSKKEIAAMDFVASLKCKPKRNFLKLRELENLLAKPGPK